MTLKNEIGAVEIFIKGHYRQCDIDKSAYSTVLNHDDFDFDEDRLPLFVIKVELPGSSYTIASVARFNSRDDHCALLDGRVLT